MKPVLYSYQVVNNMKTEISKNFSTGVEFTYFINKYLWYDSCVVGIVHSYR